MSAEKRTLTASERALWRRVTAAVEPKRARRDWRQAQGDALEVLEPALAPMRAKSEPRAPQAPRRPAPVSTPPPADRSNERRVRRGQVEIGAVLDLHGRNLEAARASLAAFLRAAREQHLRCVLVITGKGAHGEGPIRRSLPLWLESRDLRGLVAGIAEAHRSHGGAGAYYVFVKRGE